MPYIPEKTAEALQDGRAVPATQGDLAYLIAAQIERYVAHDGGMSWGTISAVNGALIGVLFEWLLRVQKPYEEAKRIQGGVDPFKHAVDLVDRELPY